MAKQQELPARRSSVRANPNQDFYEAISPLYDQLYEEVDAAEAVRQWLLLIERYEPLSESRQRVLPKLLDLGCGTGQYLAPWALAGFRVIGVDASEGMVKQARRRKKESARSSQIDLLRHDLRLPSAVLARRGPFDIAVAHLNFLNLFPLDEVGQILRQLALCVRPGTRLFTDCASPGLMPPAARERRVLPPQCEVYVITQPAPSSATVNQIYRYGNHELREKYWLHTTAKLRRTARAAGWQLEAVHAWRPDRPDSPWLKAESGSLHRVCVFQAP